MEKLKLSGDHCQCAQCFEYFNSPYSFDMHRVGNILKRRCLTVGQMRAQGMGINKSGWWISASNPILAQRSEASSLDHHPPGRCVAAPPREALKSPHAEP
jgi:hypothetical protein